MRPLLAVVGGALACSCSTAAGPTVAPPSARSIAASHATFGVRSGNTLLAARLPERANEPLRIAASGASIEVLAEDVADVAAIDDAGVRVFGNTSRDTDLLFVAHEHDIEELRVLRSTHAPRTLRWSVRATGAKLRLREGRIEAVDTGGFVRLMTAPMFALDARDHRYEPTLTLSADGEVTRVTAAFDLTGAVYPVVVDPAWSAGPSMIIGRYIHGATYLPSGKILIAGGATTSVSTYSSVEILDPKTSVSKLVAPMKAVTYGAVTAPLSTGAIACTGTLCETYDEASDKWTDVAATPAKGHNRAVTLPGDIVLMAGGGAPELYDASKRTYTLTTPITTRSGGALVLLTTGQVLFAGGRDPAVATTLLSSAELFDPTTKTWKATGSLKAIAGDAKAVRLSSGKILVVGSATNGAGSLAELYDSATGTFTATAPRLEARSGPLLVAVGTGRALLAGTFDAADKRTSSAELFDEATGKWTSVGSMSVMREGAAALPYGAGALLLGGITAGVPNATSEIFLQSTAGNKCGAALDCVSGICVDGVCCDKACAGQCDACDVPGKEGTCSPVDKAAPHGTRAACGAPYVCVAGSCATTCTDAKDAACAPTHFCAVSNCVPKKAIAAGCSAGSQCTSGFCSESVCCATACGGQCEACDTAGSAGTCLAISGPPHGSKPKCSDGGSDVCAALTCDGTKDTNACAAFANGTDKVCAMAGCTASTYNVAGTCDGAGKCSSAPQKCDPYACAAGGCKKSCATTEDCASGFTCAASVCVAAGATCVDGVHSKSKEGVETDCSPYRCKPDATCREDCATTADCVGGTLCDATSKKCVDPPTAEESSGCSASGRSDAAGFLFALLCLGLLRRSR